MSNEEQNGNIAKPNVSGCRVRPILFSGEMVRAILVGCKTQTRRIIKTDAKHIEWTPIVLNGYGGFCDEHGNPVKCKWQIGDILWVRETFVEGVQMKDDYYIYDENGNHVDKIWYRATDRIDRWFDGEKYLDAPKWKPSIFMPYKAARIFLKVTNIRVERLQNRSRGDAMDEGCPFPNIAKEKNPVEWFTSLWQKINGADSWNKNPFVWVIEFERCWRPSDSH